MIKNLFDTFVGQAASTTQNVKEGCKKWKHEMRERCNRQKHHYKEKPATSPEEAKHNYEEEDRRIAMACELEEILQLNHH